MNKLAGFLPAGKMIGYLQDPSWSSGCGVVLT